MKNIISCQGISGEIKLKGLTALEAVPVSDYDEVLSYDEWLNTKKPWTPEMLPCVHGLFSS